MKLIEDASEEKLRGGFYTPEPIADFILKWAVNGSTESDLLEPSCGDGVFLERIKENNFKYNSITAIELDKIEAKKSEKISMPRKEILNQDFYSFCIKTKKKYDLVVGNPPYIRYQYFDNQQKILAEKVFEKAGLKYSKMTNAWVSFVIGSSLLLKEKGKIGFVLPAEVLQVSYAEILRGFLSHFYNSINIVSFKKLVFPHIQQEVVLLLCEKNDSGNHFIEHIELEDADELKTIDLYSLKKSTKKIDFKTNKWTFYFLDQDEIDFLENIIDNDLIPKVADFAKVEVGTTTGSNGFFSIPLSVVKKYNLEKFAKPLVGRSVQVGSAIFQEKDWLQNRDNEAKSHLLVLPPLKEISNQRGVMEYLQYGKTQGVDKGYKTGIRDEWHIIPSVWAPDALFIRRSNLFPRLIVNKAKAFTTDTMHRVSVKNGTDINALTASFYNSLSLAFSEITGRSYGGGVLELMPNEVEQIILPYKKENASLLEKIDRSLREKMPIEQILKFTNKEILEKGYGLSSKQIEMADSIWKKLSARRLNRY